MFVDSHTLGSQQYWEILDLITILLLYRVFQ